MTFGSSMGNNRTLAIVTVLYNSAGVLDDFFASLERQTFRDFILYAVDNASPDRSAEAVRAWSNRVSFPVVLIENGRNGGVAQGNNIGVRAALAAGYEWVLLANNDTVWEPDALEKLLYGAWECGATLAVPKIRIHGTERLWSAGGAWNRWLGGTRHRGFNRKEKKRYDRVREVAYAPSCVMLIGASVFESTGYFDEQFFLYYDDSDFVRRATGYGERVLYLPQARITHKESASVGNASPLAQYFLSRNLLLFIWKHHATGYWYYVAGIQLALLLGKRSFTFSREQWWASWNGWRDGLRLCRNRGESIPDWVWQE